jgi:hypothetical protein
MKKFRQVTKGFEPRTDLRPGLIEMLETHKSQRTDG